MINIGNSIRTTIAKLIVEMLEHAYEEQLFSDKKKRTSVKVALPN